mgnify:CR=1 FL=1
MNPERTPSERPSLAWLMMTVWIMFLCVLALIFCKLIGG